ncbi:uncharacterized protein ColSpa_11095 [Colletotrichum spaethianum]|uniref:Uncharacterized protein n=1 Tax=Colletotrichum spaethianum TaxID=700344 RepID=A0AA37PEU8_9PEZI|nr:uncharacterized protein ColSpa_11095 [Colletotrichum spaethianum]GKT50914.1 hypothetical protein ColSpa_11095 [Colletotrichum spaethianum]
MASEDSNKNKDFKSVRRNLWPAAHPMMKTSEMESQQKKLADDIQQQQTNASSPVEDERHDAFSTSIEKTIREMKPAGGFPNEDSTGSSLTDEERREAFLADLYEGPYVNIGRPILVPVPRLGRTNFRGANALIVDGSSNDIQSLSRFRNNSPGVDDGPATPGSTRAPLTPIHLRSLSVDEAPRSNKVVRLEKRENTGMDIDHAIFDPNRKDFVALETKGKAIDSAQIDSAMDIEKNEAKPAPSTPPHHPPGFKWVDSPYVATPERPRTAKTAPGVMSVCDDMEADESPSLRRQMERLRVTSAGALNSCPTASSGSFSRPTGRPQGPRPYFFGFPVPRTPTMGKRGRGEFEKTITLSGRDVAREREILARFAAAAKDEEYEEDEKEEGEVEDEDDEDTPKASVLNRRMDVDEE